MRSSGGPPSSAGCTRRWSSSAGGGRGGTASPSSASPPRWFRRLESRGLGTCRRARRVGVPFRWRRRGERRLAVGARSAIFAPVANLGMIVLDEEHEATYKNGETPRYHAREVAAVRARLEGARLLLGSATPSLETLVRTETVRVGQ